MVHGLWKVSGYTARSLNTLASSLQQSHYANNYDTGAEIRKAIWIRSRKYHVIWRCLCMFVGQAQRVLEWSSVGGCVTTCE